MITPLFKIRRRHMPKEEYIKVDKNKIDYIQYDQKSGEIIKIVHVKDNS